MSDHALITWLTCIAHVACHAVITWLSPERELRGGRGDAALTSAAGSGPHAGEACTGKAALWAEVQAATALSSAHTPAHRRRASLQPVTILHPGILSGSIRESLILTAARSHLEEEQARQ